MAGDAGIDRQLVEWIQSGLDERYTLHDILSAIADGRLSLFRYEHGMVLTEITGHNRLLVFLMAGERFDEWKHRVAEDLERYADSLGIDVIEAYCRPGLEKSLKELGWKKEQVVLRRRKNNGWISSRR